MNIITIERKDGNNRSFWYNIFVKNKQFTACTFVDGMIFLE